jgi:large repetitive protein
LIPAAAPSPALRRRGGSFSFTIRATDANGNIGSRAYNVNIGTNSLTLNPATLPSGTQGTAYNQTETATGGTAPYTYAIVAGALPAGLSLNTSTGTITGTPSASGPFNFTIRATDANGNIGSRAYTLNIGTNSLTLTPATLPNAPQGSPYSQTITASGGTAPYTFSIISGALPPGLVLNASTGVITGTPTVIAVFTVTIQARDPNGNIGSKTYTLDTSRRHPAQDPNVQALINAQTAASRRFADAQVVNVTRHLESLHSDFDPCGMKVGVGISVYEPVTPDAALLQRSDGLAPPMLLTDPAAPPPAARDCPYRWFVPGIAAWVGGTMQFGSAANNGLSTSNRFSTAGVTAGIDVRVLERLIVGFGFGFGNDRTSIGPDGTRNDGTSFSGMLYASYRPIGDWFIDAVFGYASLGFDTRRWISVDSTLVGGSRSGGGAFGSLAIGPEMKWGAVKWSPYIRGDFLAARLNGFVEQAVSNQSLTFGKMDFNSTSAVLGLRGSFDIMMQWGVLTPNLRVEYRHVLDGSFNQAMWYSDIGPSFTYNFVQDATTRNLFSTTVGLRSRINPGITFDVEYGATASWAAAPVQTLRGALRLAF